jgi:hypothetical protein
MPEPSADDLGRLIGLTFVADASIKATIFFQMMYDGAISPDYLAKVLRNISRDASKSDIGQDGAVFVERLRRELFGANDSRLPAIRAQVHRARQRRDRFRHARGY